MRNRFVGDIGDFGKYGLLRYLSGLRGGPGPVLRLGIVWYLTPDDKDKNRERLRACDPDLYDALKRIVDNPARNVKSIRESDIFLKHSPCRTIFYEEPLKLDDSCSRQARIERRTQWLKGALAATSGCDIVFLDPDNGMQPAKADPYARTGAKWALFSEVDQFIKAGKSVVVYQHAKRDEKVDEQRDGRLAELREHVDRGQYAFGLVYHRGNCRMFLVIPNEKHADLLRCRAERFTAGLWGEHFDPLKASGVDVQWSAHEGAENETPMMNSKATTNFLAVDLGASNGRVLAGLWDGERFQLEELHRFPNGPVRVAGHLHTDALRLWTEINIGLAAYTARYKTAPAGIGVDTWGVDYGLLDRAGNLLGNPYHYRDARTNGVPQKLYERVPAAEVYEQTGLQTMPFNTVFQLYSMVLEAHPQLEAADKFLMLPDLFNYWLTGESAVEYTIASTSQMLLCRQRDWARGLLERLGIPARILPRLVSPGTVLGCVRPEIAAEAGFNQPVAVIASASHDTAAAVAAVPGLDESSAYISSGTWNLVGMELGDPVITEQALGMNFTNEGGVANTIRFLRNIPGLWLLQESRRQWQSEGRDYGWEQLMAEAEQAPAFRSLVVPEAREFLAPGDMPAAILEFCRRTGQAAPESVGQVVRCCLDSLALRARWALQVLEDLTGRRIGTVRIVGGGCQNRLLNQYTANASGRAVVAGPIEAAALGSVMMQAIATGHLADIRAGRQAIAVSFSQQFYEPRETEHWTAAYARFEKLVQQSELVH